MGEAPRGSWTGHVGFVLAAAGSAIGLGNIWMFPYRTGVNGGAAFVLAYLAAVALVGVPLLVAEVLIGRSTKRNPVGAFRELASGGPWWLVGALGVVTGFVILSYYGVVAGWATDYTWRMATGGLSELDRVGMQESFDNLIANGWRQVFWQALFMLGTIVVVSRGVEAGIERASKILMPLLFALILVLLGYSLTSPGAKQGLAFLFDPRFDELGWDGALAALGQAFFSLSLGMGAMITYGSYLEADRPLIRPAFFIAAMDTALAILAGLVIFPLVFSFGLEPGAGPGLIFITLPKVFMLMPGSSFVATLFFALVLFAALTSAISLLEVVVCFMIDELGIGRSTASWLAGGVIFALGVPSATTSGVLDRVDGLATNWLLPVGGLLTAVFAGWFLASRDARAAYAGTVDDARGYGGWRFCVRFLAPVAVVIILLKNLGLLGA
ncbi:MAG: sodium-dependent transporter [Candidatus Binatia bacterium]